jgi:hypothetical protein
MAIYSADKVCSDFNWWFWQGFDVSLDISHWQVHWHFLLQIKQKFNANNALALVAECCTPTKRTGFVFVVFDERGNFRGVWAFRSLSPTSVS